MPERTNTGSFRITMEDLWRQGQDTQGRVSALEGTIKQIADQRTDIDDHETRLRKIEAKVTAMWVVHGIALSATGGIVTFFVTH